MCSWPSGPVQKKGNAFNKFCSAGLFQEKVRDIYVLYILIKYHYFDRITYKDCTTSFECNVKYWSIRTGSSEISHSHSRNV